ncbi:hypothetical protein ADIS_2812 [Lunatimonas lonarensis]|uniref:Uncharacterized protein n=1 Tax=Lunatimonas lonarensis TaxID=1232681 RepID=R7ZRD2_9BACT|nr:hypothetical protein ADIS_2812 [Lunatimonas lonarensis]
MLISKLRPSGFLETPKVGLLPTFEVFFLTSKVFQGTVNKIRFYSSTKTFGVF